MVRPGSGRHDECPVNQFVAVTVIGQVLQGNVARSDVAWGMAYVALSPLRALVESHRNEIKTVVSSHRGRAVAIFGSVARNEDSPDSDVDFLVDFEPGSSLFHLVRVRQDLSRLLGHEVDIVSLGGLLPRDDDIRMEAVWL